MFGGCPQQQQQIFRVLPELPPEEKTCFADKSAVFVQQQLIFHSSLTFSPRATAAYFFRMVHPCFDVIFCLYFCASKTRSQSVDEFPIMRRYLAVAVSVVPMITRI